MPVALSSPGVYIEELPSGVRTIIGVSTSVGAFIDAFSQGPLDQAVQIFSMADFERTFGGLDSASEASYAIAQFFLNGGNEAWVVRVTNSLNPATAAQVDLEDQAAGGTAYLQVSALSPGAWGNSLLVDVDYNTTDPLNTFNLTIVLTAVINGVIQPIETETYRNLTLDSTQSNYAVAIVNNASQLVQLTALNNPTKANRPAMTGSWSKPLTAADLLAASWPNATYAMDVTYNQWSGSAYTAIAMGTVSLQVSGTKPLPQPPATFATTLQSLIQQLSSGTVTLPNASVSLVGSTSGSFYLRAKPGTTGANATYDYLSFHDGGGPDGIATKLDLNADAQTNLATYKIGDQETQRAQKLVAPAGAENSAPAASDVIGVQLNKTGMYALEDADLFNILCIPATMNFSDNDTFTIATAAEAYCYQRRAFYILDIPQKAATRDTPTAIQSWLDANATLRHQNAALYFPRVSMPDPLNANRPSLRSPSGTIAGLYALTDANRGVWKAPAGTDAVLAGVQQLAYSPTDGENGVLNPLAINCLRNFKVFGNVCWGARTLEGADQLASDWKYIPVRRLALYLEESLYRGTAWAVFEPNDEPLWSQLRLNIGAFMHDLFTQGAFQGSKPSDAYFVKCDSDTTTQNDINAGVVNVIVGFAPLKPAEFVVIEIQQLAGQIQT